MQVGFSPVNFQQRQNKTQNTNFGHKIDISHSVMRPDTFSTMMERGVHEDSKENRELLKKVVSKIKKRNDAKWDLPDIKEAVFKAWGKDDELKDMFKGY